ncbi:hypothetical protein [Devosia sp. 2618]|uniref:hypothetical protein n=1 Tax=Devosia sp. 2618 TaxID=3156454 RepID=UPI0033982EF9
MSTAQDSRNYRRRRDAGDIVLKVRVPQVDLALALIEVDRLHPRDEDDREALTRAVEKLLRYLIEACED